MSSALKSLLLFSSIHTYLFDYLNHSKWYPFLAKKEPNHTCPEGDDIISSMVCDGFNHCSDGSDEKNCYHKCPEGYNIPAKLKCDNTPHCSDSSDEYDCPRPTGTF